MPLDWQKLQRGQYRTVDGRFTASRVYKGFTYHTVWFLCDNKHKTRAERLTLAKAKRYAEQIVAAEEKDMQKDPKEIARLKALIAELKAEIPLHKDRLAGLKQLEVDLVPITERANALLKAERETKDSKFKQPGHTASACIVVTDWGNYEEYLGRWIQRVQERIKDLEIDLQNAGYDLDEQEGAGND